MKNWYGYTILDFFILFGSMIFITVVSILCNSPWYVVVTVNLGLLCVFTQAKGKVVTQFIGIIDFIFYIYVSVINKFYGEVILYAFILIPIYVYGLIHWLANRDKKDNVVLIKDNLSKKEWIISSISLILIGIIIFFVLKELKTAQLYVSTIAFVSMLPGIYLLMRRYKWNQLAFLINDILAPILWVVLVANGEVIYLPMVLNNVIQIGFDLYGMYEWEKIRKRQSIENIEE